MNTASPTNVPGEWRVTTWGEEISLEYGKAIRDYATDRGAYRVFGTNGPVGWTESFLAPGPGVILGRKGAYRGVKFSAEPFWVIDTAYYVKPKSDLDMRWLYYAIQHHKLGEIDDGSPIPSTTRSAVYVKPLEVPPLVEQKRIAHILGTLDDKIELNRRMAATLEEMARALFKSWFVDFDPVRAKAEGRPTGLPPDIDALFPDCFEDSELGLVPAGWTVKHLGEIADLDKGLSYKGEGLAEEGGMPMINLGCFNGRGTFNADRVKRYTGEYRERHLINAGDLVVANTDMTQNRIIIGSPLLVPELNGAKQFLFTHHVFAVRFKHACKIWRRYVFFTLLKPQFREIAEGFSTGTTVLALPRDGLINYSICLPSIDVLEAFEEQIGPLLCAVDGNRHQTRTLTFLRDTLLPKLISGEMSVGQTDSDEGT